MTPARAPSFAHVARKFRERLLSAKHINRDALHMLDELEAVMAGEHEPIKADETAPPKPFPYQDNLMTMDQVSARIDILAGPDEDEQRRADDVATRRKAYAHN
ncbi:MAG: hypothetical protein KAV87_29665 [Desulfobacteraceae bacterium]|nr:hypothetical protein [Desulfobacteraceae bacterium]